VINAHTLYKRKLFGLKQLKRAYLRQLFPQASETVPKLRFKYFSKPWEMYKLREIGESYTGLSGKVKADFNKGDARFITYLNVLNNSLAAPGGLGRVEIDTKQNEVKYGDIFFTTSSETPEEAGMSSVWLHNLKNVYLNSFCFGLRPKCKVSPYYMAFVLRSSNVRRKAVLLAQGVSRYNISKAKLTEIEIPLPSFEEQAAIGNLFFRLDEQITAQAQKLEQLKQLKTAYLQKMFV